MKIVLLWTDAVVFLVLAAAIFYGWKVARTPHLAATWRKAFSGAPGTAAATVLALFVIVGVVDSVPYRPRLKSGPGTAPAYAPETKSLLDKLLGNIAEGKERSYSAPLAYVAHEKEAVTEGGVTTRIYPRLLNAGTHLRDPEHEWATDVATRAVVGAVLGLVVLVALAMLIVWVRASLIRRPAREIWGRIASGDTRYRWRSVLWTLAIVFIVAGVILSLAREYHVFGTDRVGNDLLYVVLK